MHTKLIFLKKIFKNGMNERNYSRRTKIVIKFTQGNKIEREIEINLFQYLSTSNFHTKWFDTITEYSGLQDQGLHQWSNTG